MTPFADWKPARFQVFAELTENSPHKGATDKGYRYRVYLAGERMDTIEDAKRAITEDMKAIAKPNSFGGLVDWGPYAKREYAIFETIEVKRVF